MSDVDDIKARLDITEVIGQYIKLEKAGKNYRASCPFHNEKDPSFHVSPERQRYHCFGCKASGDIFTFVEEFEGLDFRGALKLLADRAGVTLSHTPYKKKEDTSLYDVMEEATRFYEGQLEKVPDVHSYLKKRGVEEETITHFRLGYAPDAWRELKEHLESLGYERKLLEEAGLAKESKGKVYDRFRDRVIFPIFDNAGRVVAFSGRLSKERKKAPKYLNSPETPLFNKSQILYGFDRAKHSIRKNDFSVLVEGQMDIVLSHQAGFRNTVASSGTSITSHHLNLLKRFSHNLILAFDNDEAGFASALRAGGVALSLGMDVKVADIMAGKDPADIIREGMEEWRKAVRGSTHIIEYLLLRTRKDSSEERSFLKLLHTQVLPLVARIPNRMEQEHFIKLLGRESNMSDTAIREELGKIARAHHQGFTRKEEEGARREMEHISRKESIVRSILGIIEWQALTGRAGSGQVPTGQAPFEIGEYKQQLSELLGKDYESLPDTYEKEELIFEAERMFEGSEALEQDLKLLFLYLQEEIFREKLRNFQSKLKRAEDAGAEEESVAHLKQCQEISLSLAEIQDAIQKGFHVI